ncbi:hypothetical protein SISSUDRAFT_213413 [Sistotremastrum suecicum HHB10207 ss-3]|uniref:Uncharacterized protein n=1 Tax=Sistotremastrum suecicum HHB10207 ss-3 TaxID=1314776 RepID=A0A166A952_9AGAM|nr:hypothetical protein SISSUDRAFT_213413 [Sistotremastrum suecicum HHB10207 ss-3]
MTGPWPFFLITDNCRSGCGPNFCMTGSCNRLQGLATSHKKTSCLTSHGQQLRS